MKTKNIRWLALLAVALVLIVVLLPVIRTPENRTYTIGWDVDPPDQMPTKDGEPTGFAVELVRAAAKRRGIRLNWVLHPESSEAALLSKAVDLWPMMTITEDRKKLLHLTDPYQENDLGLLVNAKSAFTRVGDLKQQRISYDGMPYNGRLLREHFPGNIRLRKSSLEDAVRSLCVGEADAVFADRTGLFSLLLSGSPCPRTPLRLLIPNIRTELGVGSTRESRVAADTIREEIGIMAGDGSLRKIMSTWSYDSGQELNSVVALQQARSRVRWYRIGLSSVATLFLFASWSAAGYRRQRVKAEAYGQALGLAERNVRMVADSLTEMVVAYDMDKNLTYANSGAEKLTGCGLAELQAAPPLSWTHPEDRSQVIALWDRVFAGQTVDQVVHRLITNDGKVKWVTGSWGPVIDEARRLAGIRGTCQDRTQRVVAEQLLEETTQKFRTIVEEMAERKRAEAALRESEERLRFAQKVASIGTFDWNIETGVNTWTPELEAMYGLPQGGFSRTQPAWEDLVHPDDRARAVQRVKESFEAGTPVEEEWRVIRPDGSVRWLAGRWQVLKNAAGKPLRMMGVHIDVTERKQMEEALRQSEERLRLAIAATNDAIWDIDLKTGTVSWNETYSALYGRPSETSDSWQWWIDRIQPGDRERTVDGLRGAISSGASSWTCEYRFQRADGDWAYIYDRAYIARDGAGNAWRVIGAMQDSTERKRAEAAMRESEERFRNMADTAPVMIWVTDADKRATFFNKCYLDFTGGNMEEKPDDGWIAALHREDRERFLSVYSSSIEAREEFRSVFRLRRTDGEYRWLLCTGVPRLASDGVFAGYIGSCIDITDQKHAEAVARRSLEEIAHLNRVSAMGELTASLAHELNQPLAAILSNAQAAGRFLNGASPDIPQARECLTDIVADDKRAGEVIKRLRTLLKKGKSEALQVDLNAVVGDVIRLLHNDAILRKVSVAFEPSSNLPAVQGDRVQLYQVVLNLIMNGLEASSAQGSGDHWLKVRTKGSSGDAVELTVEDSGRGIAECDLAHVFEPFFTTKPEGLGMGLSISRSIVQAHGGRLWADNNSDGGAVFRCVLPASQQAAAAAQ